LFSLPAGAHDGSETLAATAAHELEEGDVSPRRSTRNRARSTMAGLTPRCSRP
jgi:hypothetical protein